MHALLLAEPRIDELAAHTAFTRIDAPHSSFTTHFLSPYPYPLHAATDQAQALECLDPHFPPSSKTRTGTGALDTKSIALTPAELHQQDLTGSNLFDELRVRAVRG